VQQLRPPRLRQINRRQIDHMQLRGPQRLQPRLKYIPETLPLRLRRRHIRHALIDPPCDRTLTLVDGAPGAQIGFGSAPADWFAVLSVSVDGSMAMFQADMSVSCQSRDCGGA